MRSRRGLRLVRWITGQDSPRWPPRGRSVARELGLATLIAVVTWGAWYGPYDGGWSRCNCSPSAGATWATVAVAILVGLLRLRSPSLAVVGAAALLAWYPGAAGVLALTAFHATARIPDRRRLAGVFAVAAATTLGITLVYAPYPWPIVLGGDVAALAIALGAPHGVQILLTKADRLLVALRERTHYLEENYRLAHSAARLQERSRIAHEMHDQLGHRLTLISLHAGALEIITAGDAASGAREAEMISGTVRAAMQELRTTLGVLGGSAPDGAPAPSPQQAGTRPDVAQLVAESRSAGMQVEFEWRGDDLDDVPVAVRTAVHRLVREGLTNVHRHAEGARASVVVEHDGERVRVEVANTRAHPPRPAGAIAGTGLGLVGVQERTQLLGGRLSAGPTAEGGFRVLGELPLVHPAGPGTSGTGHGATLSRLNGLNGTTVAGVRPTGRRARRLAERQGLVLRATGVVLVAGLVGVQALVLVVFSIVPYGAFGTDGYAEALRDLRIGAPRQEVEEILGDDPVLRSAAKPLESPPPAGSDCRYGIDYVDDNPEIVRFCMRDDRVITIDRYALPGS